MGSEMCIRDSIEQVNEVLFDGKPADQAVKELMLRDKKLEVSHLPWPEE